MLKQQCCGSLCCPIGLCGEHFGEILKADKQSFGVDVRGVLCAFGCPESRRFIRNLLKTTASHSFPQGQKTEGF